MKPYWNPCKQVSYFCFCGSFHIVLFHHSSKKASTIFWTSYFCYIFAVKPYSRRYISNLSARKLILTLNFARNCKIWFLHFSSLVSISYKNNSRQEMSEVCPLSTEFIQQLGKILRICQKNCVNHYADLSAHETPGIPFNHSIPKSFCSEKPSTSWLETLHPAISLFHLHDASPYFLPPLQKTQPDSISTSPPIEVFTSSR